MYERDWVQWNTLKIVGGGALVVFSMILGVLAVSAATVGSWIVVGGCAIAGVALGASGVAGLRAHRRLEEFTGESFDGVTMMDFVRAKWPLLVLCVVVSVALAALALQIELPDRVRSTQALARLALFALSAGALGFPLKAFGGWEREQRELARALPHEAHTNHESHEGHEEVVLGLDEAHEQTDEVEVEARA